MSYLFRNIFLMVLFVMVVMQFIPAEKTNPPVDPELDLLMSENPPEEVKKIIKSACYDCHSHETVWPWYSYIAPAKWSVSNHVVNGRKELNFSKWQSYEVKRKDHKLEECLEAITDGWMTVENYVMMHSEADLSDAQRTVLVDYFKSLREAL